MEQRRRKGHSTGLLRPGTGALPDALVNEGTETFHSEVWMMVYD